MQASVKQNSMQIIIESILFGFSAILNYKIMKRALAIGLIVTLGWSVIGYFLWDELVSTAAYFIDLVPFSMLRSNGAWILSSFLWFSLVLVTFALILAFFGNRKYDFRESFQRKVQFVFFARGICQCCFLVTCLVF